MFNVLLAEAHLRFWVHARPLVKHTWQRIWPQAFFALLLLPDAAMS